MGRTGTGGGSACLQGTHLQHWCVPDDHIGFRPVRQPRAAADHASDAARLSLAASRDRDGTPRPRVLDRHADGGHDDWPHRSTQIGGGRTHRRRGNAVLACAAQPRGGVLGYFLAAVLSGTRIVGALRPVDHDQYGPDSA